jgi:hypothetical protein
MFLNKLADLCHLCFNTIEEGTGIVTIKLHRTHQYCRPCFRDRIRPRWCRMRQRAHVRSKTSA